VPEPEEFAVGTFFLSSGGSDAGRSLEAEVERFPGGVIGEGMSLGTYLILVQDKNQIGEY
jgi:hypothetical protein